jgi:hypothetical protein
MQLTDQLSSKKSSEIIFESDQQYLRQTLDRLPELAHAATDHADEFWERQQAEIRKRIATVPAPSSTRAVTVWAGALAMVLLALFLLHGNPAPRASGTQSDPDQDLLVAVEQSVQSGVPQALEPAAMLADEISSNQSNFQPVSRLQGESK